MPHAAVPKRVAGNVATMQSNRIMTLSEFIGETTVNNNLLPWGSPPIVDRNLSLKEDLARFPEFGSDFEDRLLESMQFVFNHKTFDPSDELDAALLAIYDPLGVKPG